MKKITNSIAQYFVNFVEVKLSPEASQKTLTSITNTFLQIKEHDW